MKQGKVVVFFKTLAISGIVSTLLAGSVFGADEVWSSNAVDGAWESGANWASGNVPGSTSETTNPDSAIFRSVSTTTMVMPDANRNIANLVFSNVQCGAYTVGTNTGNALLLSSGGMVLLASTVTNSQKVNAPLVLMGDGGAYLFTNATAKTLTIGGGITGVATVSNVTTLTLAGGNANGDSLSGIVGDGAAGGQVALIKAGAGRWDLMGTNTYSGGTILNAGKLRLANSRSLGAGPFSINGGTVYNASPLTLTATNDMTWNANFAHEAPISADMSYGPGSVTLTTNITVTLGSNAYASLMIIPGSIGESGGSRSLTIMGIGNAGCFNPRGSNTFSGGLTLGPGGMIRIGHTQCLGTGVFTINGGTISQNTGSALTGASQITMVSNFQFSCTSGAINFGVVPVVVSGLRGFSIDNGGVSIGGTISGVGGGLTVSGTAYNGSLSLSGSNTFDSGVTMSPGSSTLTLSINNASALGTGPLTINRGSGGTPRLENSSGAAITNLANNVQNWNASFTYVGATRSLNLGSGAVTLGTNVTVTVSANTLTVGGAIGAAGQGWLLSKAGAGTLALAGSCTYTGLTTVAAGKLSLPAGGALAGNVRVMTNATLEVLSSTAISDSATLQIDSNGSVYGVVNLATGVVEVVKELNLGGTLYSQSGTYGSTNSAAANKFPGYFTGTGMIQVAMPRGATLLMVR